VDDADLLRCGGVFCCAGIDCRCTGGWPGELQGIDQPAWHLKLDVTVFDAKGKNPSEGAIEVWHRNSDERTVFTFADASSRTLKHDGKTFVSATGPTVPFEAEQILAQIVHPGPNRRTGVAQSQS
jgi:hypothetical protein